MGVKEIELDFGDKLEVPALARWLEETDDDAAKKTFITCYAQMPNRSMRWRFDDLPEMCDDGLWGGKITRYGCKVRERYSDEDDEIDRNVCRKTGAVG